MNDALEFDRSDNKSVFLQFVAKEFVARGTKLRSNLANKTFAHETVKKLNFSGEPLHIPTQRSLLRDIQSLTPELLGPRCVLKYAHGWSARGVMPLQWMADDKYFDHLKLKITSLSLIIEEQEKVSQSFANGSDEWIIEEFLTSAQPGPIPFDYKFYVFQKQIGLVVQIDRNANPPKIALFDGNFQPLYEGKDYLRDRARSQNGVHLLPQHAVQLSCWALLLAQQTDSPFVSIDLYDTDKGPAFGEFTFSPGATHRRMIKFSSQLIDTFDALFQQAEAELAGQKVIYGDSWSAELQNWPEQIINNVRPINTEKYALLCAYQYNGGGRAATRFFEIFKGRMRHTKSVERSAIFAWLVKSSESILQGFKNRVYG